MLARLRPLQIPFDPSTGPYSRCLARKKIHLGIWPCEFSRSADLVGTGGLERRVAISGLCMERGFPAGLWRHTARATPESLRIAGELAFLAGGFCRTPCGGRSLGLSAHGCCRLAEARAGERIIPALLRRRGNR